MEKLNNERRQIKVIITTFKTNFVGFREYRAQNETYMCRSAENVVKSLCFNKLCAVGWNGGTKRSVYIGLISVYFWGHKLVRRFA